MRLSIHQQRSTTSREPRLNLAEPADLARCHSWPAVRCISPSHIGSLVRIPVDTVIAKTQAVICPIFAHQQFIREEERQNDKQWLGRLSALSFACRIADTPVSGHEALRRSFHSLFSADRLRANGRYLR